MYQILNCCHFGHACKHWCLKAVTNVLCHQMEYSPILSECCNLRSGAEPMEITLLVFTVCRHLTACCWITCCGAVVLLCAVVRCCCWRSSDCGHELLQNTPTLVSTPAQAARARAQHSVVTRGDQRGLVVG